MTNLLKIRVIGELLMFQTQDGKETVVVKAADFSSAVDSRNHFAVGDIIAGTKANVSWGSANMNNQKTEYVENPENHTAILEDIEKRGCFAFFVSEHIEGMWVGKLVGVCGVGEDEYYKAVRDVGYFSMFEYFDAISE